MEVPKHGLPDQGFDDHSDDEWVTHEDQESQTADWGQEWPQNNEDNTETICRKHPELKWCRMYLSHEKVKREAAMPKKRDNGWFS